MIARLRQRHVQVWRVLAVLLPLVFLGGILSRQPVPRVEESPAIAELASLRDTRVLFEGDNLISGENFAVRVAVENGAADKLWLALHPKEPFNQPDVLVYWSQNAPAENTARLPDEAFLLGAFSGAKPHYYALPTAAAHMDGFLILYSLAKQRVHFVDELRWQR